MKNKHSDKIPIQRGVVWILLSVMLISGSAVLAFLYYRHIKELYGRDAKYRIVALVQTTPEKETLKTSYLAELLDLSIDKPTNLYRFNAGDARSKLLANPLIKEAKVKKIRPGTVYIDYILRKPVAFLTDYTNTAVDAEGVLFPVKPFFTPKKWPDIYLGLEDSADRPHPDKIWGTSLKSKQTELALSLLDYITKYCSSEKSRLQRIDVSQAYASSCGQRQIVIVMEDRIEQKINGRMALCILPRILRLGTDNYLQGLANYLVLRDHLMQRMIQNLDEQTVIKQKPIVIDLRLSQLAFIRS